MKARVIRCTALVGLAALLLLGAAGCTSRGITITSVPEGAEVSINRRVVGKTPIRVAFAHYGTYRLELRKEKFETLVREATINPPVYGYDPPALFADNLIPARLNDEVYLHYVLKPLEEKSDQQAISERDALLARADAARKGTVTNPRTGEQMQIELVRAPSKKKAPEAVAAAEDEPIVTTDAGAKISLDKPTGLEPVVKEITTLPPEPGRLAGQYGVEQQPEKKGTFVSPDEAKPVAGAPRVIRTPKEEELLYAEPPPIVPAKGKDDTKGKDAKTNK